MATLSIQIAGSAVVIGTKSYTLSDADLTSLLAWAKVTFDPYIQATFNTPPVQGFVPTNQQVMAALVQSWVNGMKDAVQRFQTQPAVVPPPITLT